jgi:hypothetical protein
VGGEGVVGRKEGEQDHAGPCCALCQTYRVPQSGPSPSTPGPQPGCGVCGDVGGGEGLGRKEEEEQHVGVSASH